MYHAEWLGVLQTIIDFFSSKHEKQLKIGRSNIQIDLGVENRKLSCFGHHDFVKDKKKVWWGNFGWEINSKGKEHILRFFLKKIRKKSLTVFKNPTRRKLIKISSVKRGIINTVCVYTALLVLLWSFTLYKCPNYLNTIYMVCFRI